MKKWFVDEQYFKDKVEFYSEQLYRELSHMFKWEGFPNTIPLDYLERNLIRHGQVLFYESEHFGYDILRSEAVGMNRHNYPTTARAVMEGTTDIEILGHVERKIKRLSDSENAVEEFNPSTDGVLIYNMDYGRSSREIVEHYANQLAMVEIAFDTNLMWQNMPYLFYAEDNSKKLSIMKLFSDIMKGSPAVMVDKELFMYNKGGEMQPGTTIDIPLKAKDLLDVRNELMMKFRETVGIDTAGVDKAERVGSFEVEANEQHTKTVLEIMLQQRQIACENINAFYGLNISVDVVETPSYKGGEEDGTGDD